MAKKDIHPTYNELEIILTDGTILKTKSCCKEKKITLDIDPLNHPAWKDDNSRFVNLKDDQVFNFKLSGKEDKKGDKK
jgi:ribosomal protein L31